MFHFVPIAFHYPASPALDPSQTPSPGWKCPCSAVCGSSWSPALRPWEACVLGPGQDASMQIRMQAVICTNAPWCAHFQPVPGTSFSLRKASRELFPALGKESEAGSAPASPVRWWLALLATVRGCSANLAPKEL